jgi:hypothetical protein
MTDAKIEELKQEAKRQLLPGCGTVIASCSLALKAIAYAESLTSQLSAIRDAVDEAEQLRVQLAGCLCAVEGATNYPAKQGDYGWSLPYQKTLELHQQLRERDAEIERLNKIVENFHARSTEDIEARCDRYMNDLSGSLLPDDAGKELLRACRDIFHDGIAEGIERSGVIIATLTTERDEARKEVEQLSKGVKRATSDDTLKGLSERLTLAFDRMDMQGAAKESADLIVFAEVLLHENQIIHEGRKAANRRIEELTAELADFKSAPTMGEVDAARDAVIQQRDNGRLWEPFRDSVDVLADITRLSIASRDEAVGLLVRFINKYHIDIHGLAEGGDSDATRILEIVEGK